MADDDKERLDHEFSELLDEIRVLLPAVAVLFAFLLTLPYTGQFASIAKDEKHVYYTAFLSAAIALLLLVAPGAHHRLLWRRHDKERLLRTANVLAIAGSLSLGVTVTTVIYLVTQRLYGGTMTAAVTAITVGLVMLLWYAIPLTRRLQR